MFQMMFQLVCEPVQVTPKQTLRYKITYLLILMTIAIFITVCFFKFLVDVMFFMETVDLKYAHYYVYGREQYDAPKSRGAALWSIVLNYRIVTSNDTPKSHLLEVRDCGASY